jgi:hypothetical protein
MLTSIIFALNGGKKTEIDWLSLGFILFSEVSFFTGLVNIGTKEIWSSSFKVKVSAYAVLFIYASSSVLISITFAMLPSLRGLTVLYKLLQVFDIAAASILLLILYTITKARVGNIPPDQPVSSMNKLINRLIVLKENPKNRVYQEQLKKIYEALKYSDLASFSEKDSAIDAKVTELEGLLSGDTNEKNVGIIEVFDQISLLIGQRSSEIKGLKSHRI